MAKPTPEYELVLMLDPEVSDERRDEIAVAARKRIEEGAELKQERAWGRRKMAYEIEQRTEADYRFFRFANAATVLDELSHNLKIADGVLRFRIFKVDPGAPVIDPPPPFSLAADRPRSGGRGRRDDDRGRHEDRPPRGNEQAEPAPRGPDHVSTAEAAPAAERSKGEAASVPSGDAEPPATADES